MTLLMLPAEVATATQMGWPEAAVAIVFFGFLSLLIWVVGR